VSPAVTGANEEALTEETETLETQSISDILQGRDEKDRFASKQPAESDPPESDPEGQAAPVVETQPDAKPSPEGAPPATEAKPGPSPVPEKDTREDEIKGLKAELARLRSRQRQEGQIAPQQPVQAQKPPSVFEDEEGFVRHLTSNFDDAVFDNRLMLSEEMATDRFKDFAEVMGTEGDGQDKMHLNWVEAVRKDPSLAQQFRRASNPSVFAYQTLKRQAFLNEVGQDTAAYKDRLRAELRAELEAELKTAQNGSGQAQTAPKPEPVVPATLAGMASKASREAPEFNGPKPLGDILAAAPFNRQR